MKVDILIATKAPFSYDSNLWAEIAAGIFEFDQQGGYQPEIFESNQEQYGTTELWQQIKANRVPVPSIFFVFGSKTLLRLSGSAITKENVLERLLFLSQVQELGGEYYYNDKPIAKTQSGELKIPFGISPAGIPIAGFNLPLWAIAIAVIFLITKFDKNG